MASIISTTNTSPPAKKQKKVKKKKKKKASAGFSPAKKRLMRDFKQMLKEKTDGVSAAPVDANIFQWQAVMFGPGDTPWEGGTFHLLMDFTEEYPKSTVVSPGITIAPCLNIWSPIFSIWFCVMDCCVVSSLA